MTKKIIKIKSLVLMMMIVVFAPKQAISAPLGDRLVLTINGIPYSQLQIEGYLDVKESLRDDPGKSQLVDKDNWNVALASFMKDMTLYQEANRTSGFRPTRDVVTKATERVQKVSDANPRFKNRFNELGFDTPTIREYISRILSIENLRRSRNALRSNKEKDRDKPKNVAIPDWEDELMKRALIRWFEHGKTYENLNLNMK